MITYAHLHKDEVGRKLAEFIAKPEAMYFAPGHYIDFDRKIEDNTYFKLQLVAIHNNAVQGYFAATLDRQTMVAHALLMCKFCDDHELEFAADLTRIFHWLKSEWRLIRWFAFVGSPTEDIYRKIAYDQLGSVVGRFKHYSKLRNGEIADVVFMEVPGTVAPTGSTVLPDSFEA